MRTLPKEPTPFCGRFLAFCLMSASLGPEIGGLGKFSVGFMLKRTIKNGVNVLRMDTLLQGRRAENHSAGKIGLRTPVESVPDCGVT